MSSPGRLDEGPIPNAFLAPTRALLGHLSSAGVREIGRALHAKLNAPPTPAERRIAELRYLTALLEEVPQYPGRPPYVPRTVYDQRRTEGVRHAPPSARLTERYGSWPRACRAAWGLLQDGRYWGDDQPWPHVGGGTVYTHDEVAAGVRECADVIGRIPSSWEYHTWGINRRARARARGEPCRIATYITVLRVLAPDRSNRNGWGLVVACVFPHGYDAASSPPD
jgi:hypothetical protein